MVTWWRENSIIPFNNKEFEYREDYSLLIHSVKVHNLGIYTCQAYNGYGKAASWAVTVKARGPYQFTNPKEFIYKQYIINPEESVSTTESSTTTTTTVAAPTAPPKLPPFRPTPEPWFPPETYTEPSNEIFPEQITEGVVPTPSLIGNAMITFFRIMIT